MTEHGQHWSNPETGQVECECCCSWALDMEEMLKALRQARREYGAFGTLSGETLIQMDRALERK